MEIVGVPREIKVHETRVGLTPEGVRMLVAEDIPVLVERDAGVGCGFSDDDYRRAGASVETPAKRVWKEATLIKKVKEPTGAERGYLTERHILFTFLHLAAPDQKELLESLTAARATAIGYETIELAGTTPLLKAMSVIAGTLAGILAGVYRHLATVSGDKVLLSAEHVTRLDKLAKRYPHGFEDLPPGRVVVIGGGHVGLSAAESVVRLGGHALVTEVDARRLKYLRDYFAHASDQVEVIDGGRADLEGLLEDSDCIVGAVYRVGARAPVIVTEDILRAVSIQKKKVIIDVAIDQGGNVAQSKPTTFADPMYVDSHGNKRFGVTNIPCLVPLAASRELERASVAYTAALAKGLRHAFHSYPELWRGTNVYKGGVVNKEVATVHGKPFVQVNF